MALRRRGSDHKVSKPVDIFSKAAFRSATRRSSAEKSKQVPIKAKDVTKTAVNKQAKEESKENLHRNISQADSTMPRMKDSHSSL
jgi:uncharacterized protein involved in propanediol utilization